MIQKRPANNCEIGCVLSVPLGPTISVCCGFNSANLPIGLQITGAPGLDNLVLSLAAAYEAATGFHTRRPTV